MSDLHTIHMPGEGEPKADVIFVHGLGGDAFTTWQHDQAKPNDSWPYWLAEEVPDVAVWTLGYDAAWHRWFGRDAMPLTHRALDVLGELVRHRIGRAPIVLICHSLGGLVVKQVLLSAVTLNNPAWQRIAHQTRAIAFVGTPHAGADLASLLFRLGRILGTSPAIEDLRAHDSNLIQLNIWYRQNAARLGVRSLCYFETRKTKVKRLGFLPWGVQVVAAGDADPGIDGVIPSPLGCEHLALCKPIQHDTRLCHEVAELVRAVLDNDQADRPQLEWKRREPVVSGGAEGPVGFHTDGLDKKLNGKREVGSPNVKALGVPADPTDFQEREDIQHEMIKALGFEQNGVVVIYGIGGCEKTTLAVHVARILSGKFADG